MSDDLLKAAIASFEAAAMAFDSARLVLKELVDARPSVDGAVVDDDPEGPCRHPRAITVSTMGGDPGVYLCPDCGDQFT